MFVFRGATPVLFAALLATIAAPAVAQSPDVSSAMHWREIGPTRAGRARALSGVASQPNVFYAGFDNGGVWRTTDYGSTWHPIFDEQPTGSIGAIAVAPSDPNIIYVGSGAGIIRPDLSTGDGVYKSTDAGKTWTHLGLRETRMIANIEVDPKNPNRLFVAALGHPYGPNAERGIFRSVDGGQTFEKVLYKDEYTSGNDVRIDPTNPNIVYAALWQQQQSFIEGREFAGTGNGIFKSTDGGSTWRHLTSGLPSVIEANLAIAPSNSRVIYAMVAGTAPSDSAARSTTGVVGFYKSIDAGEHWRLTFGDTAQPVTPPGQVGEDPHEDPDRGNAPGGEDPRPLLRIGGGDLPTITVDPKHEDVVYSASIVFWRTEDGGRTWSAVRGAPGGDDYQKVWINPNNPDIVFVVSDQGAVVSANRGASWSNWYTQNTAAMYHATTDNAFPYRVCSGQQDSGSACVESRSMDGEITFHDWHPVNIQEYGIAAPDPRDADRVFGSMRTNVSLYDRRTRQTTYLGPDAAARGTEFNRNVRTMPINWSPLDRDLLFYVSNAIWKTTDRGHSWTRISPDLARQQWTVPASAGKYANGVTVAPSGSITAFSPSSLTKRVLWAGTDDGTIHVTTDAGTHWSDVTPPQIKPWTRIFNMDAGHFDTGTAYAAANTLRIDDANPHFWRTHDGGKSWTEIDNGIAPGAVANSIREDPRTKGVLYASTDTQVWVSFDDGDHWQSLRLDMPAVSVRDLVVKDDSSCLCSDLIAATHGRGFWILDDVTPLRQAAEAKAAGGTYLFKPVVAARVRFATNDPTPWPPELPAGENPPAGAIIDYTVAVRPNGPLALAIVDRAGGVIRSYSSADSLPRPDAALDPEAYEQLCDNRPTAPHCALPLYWPAPPTVISTAPGMHRVSWDMRYDPIGKARSEGVEDVGAVPNRSYPPAIAPWAPAGSYTVRLTVDGRTLTQPLTLRLDPRLATPAAGLAQLAALTREMYDGARASHEAYEQARTLVARLDTARAADALALKAQVEAIAPTKAAGSGPQSQSRGRGAHTAVPVPATLDAVSDAMLAAAMSMQGADVTPTASQVAACARVRAQYREVMKRWTAVAHKQ